jgi:single-stranded-DNA-specific exonuclease
MQWKILPKKSDDLTEQLLINRGIKSKFEKEKFFSPKLSDFESDLKIPGIPKARARIEKAIKNGELIIAYGDYDMDGIAGAAVLYMGLTKMGAKVLPYIPHRDREGYGLSKLGLEFARDSGASLVISTDTGIVAFEQAEFVKSLGLDLIITDHHQTLNNKFPDAFAVIHSLKMCGAAVAWTLLRDDSLLDYVALATVSDMMPLIGINRALLYEGLKRLNKTDRVGLKALFDESGLELGQLTSYDIGHVIAPRLNAMGRLEHAIDSLRLLCTKDEAKAKKLAQLVSDTNEQRKILTGTAVDEAKFLINGSKQKLHVISSKDWSSGIIGLVAGRVCDETGCSTVAIAIGEEYSKGSARAGKGDDIVKILRECEDLLEAVGGHTAAAGFTIKTANIPKFQKKLESLTINVIREEVTLEVEAEIPTKNLNLSLVKQINRFEPFGMGNEKPTFATFNMKLSDLRTVGSGKHLKGKADGVDFIAFGMGNMESVLETGQLVNIAYTLEANQWNGRENVQLKVKDIQTI